MAGEPFALRAPPGVNKAPAPATQPWRPHIGRGGPARKPPDFDADEFDAVLAQMGVEPLPVSIAHAIAAGRLPRHHDDPFDRMLIAQAQLERLVLVTEDAAIAGYDVAILGRDDPRGTA